MTKPAFIIFAALFAVTGNASADDVAATTEATQIIAVSKNYVDSGLITKANATDLAPVAFSGSYNDLTDKPNVAGPGASLYEVKSNSISNAVNGDQTTVTMDGLVFGAYKVANVNYWGIRLTNNTGGAITIASSFVQQYGGIQNINKESINLANGAAFSPDNSDDTGYGKEDAVITHIFDTTNMHLYRWTVQVYVNKAILVVEKLY